ncbi:MAG: phage tail protein [Pseudomonadota bacterium]
MPIIFGTVRIAPNLLWYANFKAIAHQQKVGKGGGCFRSSVRVATPDGPRRIAEMRLGDPIYCCHPLTGEMVFGSVVEASIHRLGDTPDRLLDLVCDNGAIVSGVTDNHHMWVPGEASPTEAGSLIGGDPLVMFDGSRTAFSASRNIPSDPDETVHNLTVEPWHNYFAEGVLVHNGGGGKGPVSYTYTADLIWGIGQGSLESVAPYNRVWVGKAISTMAAQGMELVNAWPYLATNYPSQYLTYPGMTNAAAASYNLGTSPDLTNINFEMRGGAPDPLVSITDLQPLHILLEILGNLQYGLALGPYNFSGNPLYDWYHYRDGAGNFVWDIYSAYTICSGLLMSIAYTDQRTAAEILQEIATFTNSEWVWSNGALYPVSRGTVALSGTLADSSVVTYTPPTPVFDLTDDDFLLNAAGSATSSSSSNDPVIVSRKRVSDQMNTVQIEYLDRANQYAPAIAEANDQALSDVYGRRSAGSQQAHLFATTTAANTSAQLLLQKEYVRNTYSFTLDARYVVLDPMDIVTLTDAALGLDHTWARITEMTEQADGTIAFLAEEVPLGGGEPALYSFSSGQGFSPDYSADPGPVNVPIIFAAPTQLTAGALQVWGAVSGASPNWGGCNIWISLDGGSSYAFIGTQIGAARMGVLNTLLPVMADPDVVDTPTVDLTESFGELLSVTQQEADQALTLSIVDAEFFAYETATLTAPNTYQLSYLRRALYGSHQATHVSSPFARLDGEIFKYPYQSSQIGETVYLKFTSFNIFQGGEEALSDVVAYPYVIGSAPDSNRFTLSQAATPDWPGTLSGFLVTWDGILVPDSTVLASGHTNAQLFTQFVPFPVSSPTYQGAVFDIGLSEPVNVTIRPAASAPNGGVPNNATALDHWSVGSDPATFAAFSTGSVTARYFRAQITQDTSVAPSYVTALALNIFN